MRAPRLADATPRGAVRYARANKLPAIVILFALAVTIAIARQKHAPDTRQTAGLAVAAVVVVLAASVVPELVVAFLFALVVVQAIESAGLASDALDRLVSLLPSNMVGPPRSGVQEGI